MIIVSEKSRQTKNVVLNTLDLSVVIPVYNEELLLTQSVKELQQKLEIMGWNYELIITENGSTDKTREILKDLETKYPQVRSIQTNEPNYGLALRRGIKEASGTYIVCDEIDICDIDFYQRALRILKSDTAEMVVGSKRHPEAQDNRPPLRRLATSVVNLLLNILLDFKGTDTHGLKAFHRQHLLPIVDCCIVDKDIFATELVIRAQHEHHRIVEIPIEIEEKRQTSIPLLRRVPKALKQIFRLVLVIRFNKKV